MLEMPADPHGKNTYHGDDECSAVGVAVLDVFAEGADCVVVLKRGDSYGVYGIGAEDEPTVQVGGAEDAS